MQLEPSSVVIGIVATDEINNIKACLQSLDASNHLNFWVIICENGGHDAFACDVSELTQMTLMKSVTAAGHTIRWTHECHHFEMGTNNRQVTILNCPTNLGYAGGVNACIAAAGDEPWDAIWVLNPDTFPEPDALSALVRRQRQGGYGIVGSRLVYVSSGRVQTWGGLEWNSWLGRARLLGFNQPFETLPDVQSIEGKIDFISGASMFVSREYIEAVGGMDNDFFVYDEDVEWSLRRGSFKLGYAHDSIVRHISGATSGSSGPRPKRSRFNIYLTERNRILLARKRFPIRWPVLTIIAFAETFEHLVRFRSFRSFQIAVQGWLAGLQGETGVPRFMRQSTGGDIKPFLKKAA
jgi:GT2 family glycosyltransferase